jgi:hypothetical protein
VTRRLLWYVLAGLGLIVLIAVGLRFSASTYTGFWMSFVPNLWANVIGVSLGAVIGIPVGLGINHYFSVLAENRARRQRSSQARDLLQHVQREVNSHLPTLQRLGQLFPATSDQPTTVPQATAAPITHPPVTPEIVASSFLQDASGRRALSDRILFEVGESLACFEVSNYYARVGELHRLLNYRIQYGERERPGTWDRAIHGLVQTVWIAQQQVGLEIEHAIERLGQQIIQ